MPPAPLTAPLVFTRNCTTCAHPVAAVSLQALNEALGAHVDYVNQRLDRATDIHFREHRLDELIES